MIPHSDPELEALVDRELKALPLLNAPASLAPRVLAALVRTPRAPWYRTGWYTWPLGLRAASLGALLAFFGGLCFGAGRVTQASSVTELTGKLSGAWSLVCSAITTLGTLIDAALQFLREFHPGVSLATVGTVFLACAACATLGTIYLRFTFTRR